MGVATLVATVAAADKKVPPRHPLQRLSKLGRFAGEWCDDNLSAKAATNWNNKFANNVARFEARFERCGHYDESQEHGGPAGAERKRRDAEDACLDIDSELCRYDKSNPIRGIKRSPPVSASGPSVIWPTTRMVLHASSSPRSRLPAPRHGTINSSPSSPRTFKMV